MKRKICFNAASLVKKMFSTKFGVNDHHFFLQLVNESNLNTYDFHYYWLRHRCPCLNGCVHPKTNERVLNTTDIDLAVKPKSVSVNNINQIEIVWNDGHESKYEINDLVDKSYSKNRTKPHIKYPRSDLNQIIIDYSKVSRDEYKRDLLNKINEYGLAVIKNRGMDTEEIIKELGGNVIETHFGRIEDLKTNNTTNKNNDQLGYTNSEVRLHTDIPFIQNPPPFQFLHCISPAPVGGENYFANSKDIALYIKQIDPKAFEILSTFQVTFDRIQKNYRSTVKYPIFLLNKEKSTPDHPEIDKVRSSYFTYGPFDFDFENMDSFFRAYNLFTELSERYQYYTKLSAGDYVIYNNYLIQHARNSFIGDRHMKGVYLESEDLIKALKNI